MANFLCVGQIQPNMSKNLQILHLPTWPQAYHITHCTACRRGVKRLLSTKFSLNYKTFSGEKKLICYYKTINEAPKRKQIKWRSKKTNKTNTGEQTKGIIWKQQQSNNSMHSRGLVCTEPLSWKARRHRTNCVETEGLYTTQPGERDVCTVPEIKLPSPSLQESVCLW